MKASIFCGIFLTSVLVLNSCNSTKNTVQNDEKSFKIDTLSYFDKARSRKIPVAIYESSNKKNQNKIPVFFSHGYGMNKGDAYVKDYSYLLEFLAEEGYFVVSIQHELTSDSLLSSATPIREVRMPIWKRGSANILYVLNEIKKQYPNLKFNKTVLIGHSNGGDQSVLFAHEHPELLDKLISMDNRRMDLPKVSHPKIYTLRSNDHPADEGVLPNEIEQKKLGITVQSTNINHDRMDEDANPEERKFITTKISQYLHEK